MGQLLLEDVVLNVLRAVEGVFHLPVYNFKLALEAQLSVGAALGGVVVGGAQFKVVKHAGHGGAPVDHIELPLVAESVQAYVIGSGLRFPLGSEVDAGEIGRGLCLLQPVPVEHGGGSLGIDLPQQHLALEHVPGVVLPPAVRHILLRLPVLLVHLLHRALCLFQFLIDHAQQGVKMGYFLRGNGLLGCLFLFHRETSFSHGFGMGWDTALLAGCQDLVQGNGSHGVSCKRKYTRNSKKD